MNQAPNMPISAPDAPTLITSGITHAVTDQTPPERRSLKRGPEPKFKTARMMSEARRKLGFFSALQTSGSFTMMQAGSF